MSLQFKFGEENFFEKWFDDDTVDTYECEVCGINKIFEDLDLRMWFDYERTLCKKCSIEIININFFIKSMEVKNILRDSKKMKHYKYLTKRNKSNNTDKV